MDRLSKGMEASHEEICSLLKNESLDEAGVTAAKKTATSLKNDFDSWKGLAQQMASGVKTKQVGHKAVPKKTAKAIAN